jgi:hypothetical protein
MPPPPPHIGLVLLRAEWFDTVVALPELRYAMEQDAAACELMRMRVLTIGASKE